MKKFTFLRDAEGVPKGECDQYFRLTSPPCMQPTMALVFDRNGELILQEGGNDDPQALRELLGNFVTNLNLSYGGYDGLMLIGATVGYFAGPEIFRLRNEFPGIWICGPKGSGKTYTAKWLAAIHGFSELGSGLGLKTTSPVGLQIMMGQFSNMPAWADEFKEDELRDNKSIGVIHSGFNREVPSKYSENGRPWTIRTNCLITGETTCGNAATMSRFVTAVASRERWQGTDSQQLDRCYWLEDHRKFFFVIGRIILQKRETFAKRVIEHLAIWERLTELGRADSRARFSYGISYAAFMALNEIVSIYSAKDCDQFRKWLVEKVKASAREVADRGTLHRFFRDLVSMHTSGWFGKSKEELSRYFKLVQNRNSQPCFSERQLADAAQNPKCGLDVPCFAVRPAPLFSLWNKYCRNQGVPLPPSQSDVQAELKVCQFFVQGPRQGHQMKFGQRAKSNSYCWLLDLAKLDEFGLRDISDEAWTSSFHRDGSVENGLMPSDEWVDPRKGELFAIVDALNDERNGNEPI